MCLNLLSHILETIAKKVNFLNPYPKYSFFLIHTVDKFIEVLKKNKKKIFVNPEQLNNGQILYFKWNVCLF